MEDVASTAWSPVHVLITVWVAVVGLSIGSFSNVVIARLPLEDEVEDPPTDSWWETFKQIARAWGRSLKRLSWPPSRCPKCEHRIRWFENIPVVSWVALRGRCSSCKTPISPRYILVELLTGTLFVAALARYPLDWPLISALACFTFLVPLIFIDAEHWILPFELTLPGIACGLLLAVPQGREAFFTALYGALAAFLAFRALEFFGWLATGREAMGAGDKYLMAMVGAQVGWRGLLGVILFSSLQGAVVGLVRMRLTGRAGPPVEAPEAEPPATEGDAEEPPPGREPFTPAFLAAGLPWWKRALLVPYTIFLQDIPDSPPPDETTGEVPDWEPQANNIPFGPWIGLAGIEVMLLGPWAVERLAHTQWRLAAELIFGA